MSGPYWRRSAISAAARAIVDQVRSRSAVSGAATSVSRVTGDVAAVSGHAELLDGSTEPVTRETLVAAPETALRLLTWSTIALAAALIVLRLQ